MGATGGRIQKGIVAGVEGLEPPTYWFEARRSIQLSYTPAVNASMLAEIRGTLGPAGCCGCATNL